MKKLAVLGALVLGLGAGTISAQETLPYTSGFEIHEGFEKGNLEGQGGWRVDQGSAEVQSGIGIESSQGLRILPSDPFGQISLHFNPQEESDDATVFTDFYVKPVAASNEEAVQFVDAEGSIAGFFKIDHKGELFVLNGDGNEGGEWVSTGERFATTVGGEQIPQWVRVSLRQDFQAKVWDLYLNGETTLVNLGMWSDEAEFLSRFSLMGHSQFPLDFDDLAISGENGVFEDEDRDGMPDEWEKPLGEFNHRDDDPDDDGLTNIEELMLGTDPMNPDSDGDGSFDGSFLARGPVDSEVSESSSESGEEQDERGRIKEDPEVTKAIEKRRKDERKRQRNFKFSENPSEGELISSQILLVPFAREGEATDRDRGELAKALEKYVRNANRHDVRDLEKFVKANPESPYRLWVEAAMGYALWEESRFSKAVSVYSDIWSRKKDADQGEVGLLVNFVGGKLARSYASAGGEEKLRKVLSELARTRITDDQLKGCGDRP